MHRHKRMCVQKNDSKQSCTYVQYAPLQACVQDMVLAQLLPTKAYANATCVLHPGPSPAHTAHPTAHLLCLLLPGVRQQVHAQPMQQRLHPHSGPPGCGPIVAACAHRQHAAKARLQGRAGQAHRGVAAHTRCKEYQPLLRSDRGRCLGLCVAAATGASKGHAGQCARPAMCLLPPPSPRSYCMACDAAPSWISSTQAHALCAHTPHLQRPVLGGVPGDVAKLLHACCVHRHRMGVCRVAGLLAEYDTLPGQQLLYELLLVVECDALQPHRHIPGGAAQQLQPACRRCQHAVIVNVVRRGGAGAAAGAPCLAMERVVLVPQQVSCRMDCCGLLGGSMQAASCQHETKYAHTQLKQRRACKQLQPGVRSCYCHCCTTRSGGLLVSQRQGRGTLAPRMSWEF